MAISLTSSGITATSSLNTVVNGNTTETIDSNGAIVQPKRLAFRYFPGNTGANTEWNSYNSTAQGKSFQVGSAFNTTTGRFTAPVTGIYHFDISAMTQGSTTHLSVYSMINGSLSYGCRPLVQSNFGGTHNNTSYSCTTYLAAGDYFSVYSNPNGAAHAGDWAAFSGYLVGAYN